MPRRGLNQAAVVEAAADLADADGLEALTLASLAEQLGVRTPSLYNHVAGLHGLRRDLGLLGLQLLGERLTRATVGRSGEAALVALADAYRAFARERPGLYAASLRAVGPEDPRLAAAGGDVVDVVLAVLAGFGLRGADALHATRGLRAVVHGFVSLEQAGGFGLPLDLDESFHRLMRALARDLTA